MISYKFCLLFYFIKSIYGYFKLGITDKKSKKESNSIVSLLLMSAALPIAPFIYELIYFAFIKRQYSIKQNIFSCKSLGARSLIVNLIWQFCKKTKSKEKGVCSIMFYMVQCPTSRIYIGDISYIIMTYGGYKGKDILDK